MVGGFLFEYTARSVLSNSVESFVKPLLSCSPLRCTSRSRADDIQSGICAINWTYHPSVCINALVLKLPPQTLSTSICSTEQCWHAVICNVENGCCKYTILPSKAVILLHVYTDLVFYYNYNLFTQKIVSLARISLSLRLFQYGFSNLVM